MTTKIEPLQEVTDKQRADCNMACLLHLVEMVERGEIDEAKQYCEYVRSMLRLTVFVYGDNKT